MTIADPLERLLLKDRGILLASLTGLTILAWLYLILLSVEMAHGDMSLMGMKPMTAKAALIMAPQPWSPATVFLMLVMWWIMMVGMMVPSAAPMILLFARIQRKTLPAETPAPLAALFTLGYGLTWLGFSLAATLLQWALSEAALLSPMMVSTSAHLGAIILAAAGLYQLTPLKHACLEHCRSPLHFLSRHWRHGKGGALQMGLAHGAYCVGCCWFLMALLFVGGVMNLLWVAAIAVFVLIEKLWSRGAWLGQASGAAMLALAVLVLVAT